MFYLVPLRSQVSSKALTSTPQRREPHFFKGKRSIQGLWVELLCALNLLQTQQPTDCALARLAKEWPTAQWASIAPWTAIWLWQISVCIYRIRELNIRYANLIGTRQCRIRHPAGQSHGWSLISLFLHVGRMQAHRERASHQLSVMKTCSFNALLIVDLKKSSLKGQSSQPCLTWEKLRHRMVTWPLPPQEAATGVRTRSWSQFCTLSNGRRGFIVQSWEL